MAKNGFKIFDSDMHIMEPPDLWERYIDPEFRAQAPRGRTSENVRDLGTIFPTLPKDSRRTGGTPHRGRNTTKTRRSTEITPSAAGQEKFSSKRWTPRA
jgi:hypothetical protein